MRILLAAAVIALAPVLIGRAPDASQDAVRGWDRVAALYQQRVGQAGIVGSGLVLVRRGSESREEFVGYQDAQAQQPVDGRTIFHWASITKMFTGIAIVQLRDRGLLSLDDPVVKYVPELQQVHSAYGDISKVKIRHLMSHSAGFRAPTWPWGGDKPWHPFEPTRWEQVVAMFPYTELLFEPGTQYSYSNPGVIFLGRVIERLTGDDYEMYVMKNILKPLAMERSFFDKAPYFLRDQRSHGYRRTDEGLSEQPFDFDTGITVSNGGLNAPIADMVRFLDFLIGDHPDAAVRRLHDVVLKRSSLDEMFTPQIRAREGEGGSGDDVQAGLSCFIERYRGVELVGHSGDQAGFISHLYVHRPSRSGYIVSFNTDVSSSRDPRRTTRAVDNDLRDAMIREIFAPGASR